MQTDGRPGPLPDKAADASAGLAGLRITAGAGAPQPTASIAGRKRVAIAAEAATDASTVRIPNVPKSHNVLRVLAKAVTGNLLFDMLTREAKRAIFASMEPLMVSAGTAIITQGDEDASTFYVLEIGNCDVFVCNESTGGQPLKVHSYTSGSGFGELALLYSAPRAATVKATTDCKLWVMQRTVYHVIKQLAQRQAAAERRKLIGGMPMLAMLSPERRGVLADALEVANFAKGDTVYSHGEPAESFYLVSSGTATATQSGREQQSSSLQAGSYFGERALLKPDVRQEKVVATSEMECYGQSHINQLACQRQMQETVIATSEMECYALDRATFTSLLGPVEDLWRFEALRKVPILFALSEAQLFELARCMGSATFKAGQLVFRKGDPGDMFYVIEEGSFTVFNEQDQELARVGKGSCFGELALLRQDVRAASVKALADSSVLTLTRALFSKLLGNLGDIRHMWRFEALNKVALLSLLSNQQRSQLCTALKPIHVPQGTMLVAKGEVGDAFYIVESGICQVLGDANQEVSRLGPTMFFGELALLSNEPRAASVKAATAVDLLALSRADFQRLLGPLQDLMAANAAKYAPLVPSSKAGIALRDLKRVTVLGAGAFGQVLLVKAAGQYYALKCLNKEQIVKMGLQEHVKREKQMMAECSCSFMVNLVAAFNEGPYLYLLMECIMGGELFTYLQTRGAPLSEDQARFHAASVICGLEYLHEHSIVWRDLKPENLLMDRTGYLKIADFGFAKKLPPGQKTNTLCGTPEYLAPELVTQAGHTRAVDWWAVGVLIFEMVAGHPPFYDEDRVRMFKNICSVKYTCPPTFSRELKDLVKRLLVHAPAQRMCMGKSGVADLTGHPWFAGFDWARFRKQELTPPYKPKIAHPEDTRNFVACSEEHPAGRARRGYQSQGIFKDF